MSSGAKSGHDEGEASARWVGSTWSAWQTFDVNDVYSAREWLTVPDVADRLSTTPSRVRRLVEERTLLAVRIDGVLKVPAVFIDGDEPFGPLRGTITLLSDNGFSDDEAMDWMLGTDEILGAAPIDALIAGRKAEVRRVAQSLA